MKHGFVIAFVPAMIVCCPETEYFDLHIWDDKIPWKYGKKIRFPANYNLDVGQWYSEGYQTIKIIKTNVNVVINA